MNNIVNVRKNNELFNILTRKKAADVDVTKSNQLESIELYLKKLMISIRETGQLLELAYITEELIEAVNKYLHVVKCTYKTATSEQHSIESGFPSHNNILQKCIYLFALLSGTICRKVIELESLSTRVLLFSHSITDNEEHLDLFSLLVTKNLKLERDLRKCQEHFATNTVDSYSTTIELIYTVIYQLTEFFKQWSFLECVEYASVYALGELQDLHMWLKEKSLRLLQIYTSRLTWNVTEIMFMIADLTDVMHDCFDVCNNFFSMRNKFNRSNNFTKYNINNNKNDNEYEEHDKIMSRENSSNSAMTSLAKSEILEVTEWVIPLKDPITQSVILIPARGKFCTHLEVFDLESFVRLVQQRVEHSECTREDCGCKCPHCSKYILLSDVRIDKPTLCAIIAHCIDKYNEYVVEKERNRHNLSFQIEHEESAETNKVDGCELAKDELYTRYLKEIINSIRNEELTLHWDGKSCIVKSKKRCCQEESETRHNCTEKSDAICEVYDKESNLHKLIEAESNKVSCKCTDERPNYVDLLPQDSSGDNITLDTSQERKNKLKITKFNKRAKQKRRRIEIGNRVMYVDEKEGT